MQHRFLFDEREWLAEGTYTDADGITAQVNGRYSVQLGPEAWRVDTKLTVIGASTKHLSQRFTLVPFEAGAQQTTWRTAHATIGMMEGRYTIISDTILATCETTDRRHHGCEAFVALHDGRYVCRGALYQGNTIIATWAVLLSPVSPPERPQAPAQT